MAALAYDVVGTGPALVLVHGLGSSRHCWDLVMDDLASDFTVYTVDLPGHGDSDPVPDRDAVPPSDMADALGAFMDDQGVDRAHLVGNSLGGWTVLEAAANGRARSVVALCPAGLWVPFDTLNRTIEFNRRAAVATRKAIPAIMRVPALRASLMRAGAERSATVPYGVAVGAGLAQAEARGFAAARAGATGNLFTRADEIPADIPVTIVFGDNDRILPAPNCQVRDLAPAHARWDVLWNCGHAPMWDVPRVTTELIRAAAAASQ